MCTVSWIHREDGYFLLFNRDELRTRKPGFAPRVDQRNGVAFIAPVDGDQGGSWIAVNEIGLTLCLLNRFNDLRGETVREYKSRGLLLHEMIDCSELATLERRLDQADLSRFRPFTLVAVRIGQPAQLIEWTGSETRVEVNAEKLMPIASSSLRGGNVVQQRKQQFQEMVLGREKVEAELLYQYHRSHLPERGPASVCMHRPDARTVSMSAVTVTGKVVEFVYHPNSPCQPAETDQRQIERALVIQ